MAQNVPFSMPFLRSHSIFIPPSSSTSTSQDDEWELVDRPTDDLVGQKFSRMVMREKDLLVAMGRDVRMMSLAGGEGGWELKDGKLGSYKTLKAPNLNFTIHQLVLNPNGRLLAVVGHQQIVVLVLPKSSYSSSSLGEIECRAISIDEYQFSPSSNDVITKVAWHPWGEGGNSLWVLTADGKLREYDINQPRDAMQTFNFLPSTSSSSSTKFTAIDPFERYATSFAFSFGSIDFSPLMVYVLIANGDIYTMGPILPLHTEMPIQYLQGLKAYSEGKLSKIQNEARDVFGASEAGLGRATFQSQWVESLVKQVKLVEEAKQNSPYNEVVESPVSRRTSLLGRSTSTRSNDTATTRARPAEGTVRIHPPHLTESGGPASGAHRTLLRQGPLLYSPAPQDIGNGDEDAEQAATDLLVYEASTSENQKSEKETIFAIAWSGGRVDIGIEVEKPEPRWMSSRDPSTSTLTVPIIESVLLPFPQADFESIDSNAPGFVADPLYSDVIYVQHSFGIDSINIKSWLEALDKENAEELPASKVKRHVESGGSPVKPIVGVVNFCNINLGYGLVALASSGQAAFVELDLRVADSVATIPAAANTVKSVKATDPDAQSLLLAKPLDFDKLLNSIRNPSTPYNPLAILRQRISDSSKPTTSITPDHLRVLGEISGQVRNRTQSLRTASQNVENRLDLQVKELQRQIKLLKECQAKVSTLKRNLAIQRAEELLNKQEQLSTKLDGLVNKLSEEFKPEVGEQERKWFDELERLKLRVRGGSGIVSKGKALTTKKQILQEQLFAIKPAILESRARQEEEDAQEQNQNYGSKQLKPLEAALGARSEELRRLIRRMEILDMRVDSYGLNEED
ncbi:uncharacterized protein L201_007936 [Kwoniella dendrophila CBS 6074]|uniref:Nucleoporin Nup82 n=1 Tax=Kwoniella dendrophila CBS 6074 TaxID=1295534 RepID=A0AAX4K7B6_9TREE